MLEYRAMQVGYFAAVDVPFLFVRGVCFQMLPRGVGCQFTLRLDTRVISFLLQNVQWVLAAVRSAEQQASTLADMLMLCSCHSMC